MGFLDYVLAGFGIQEKKEKSKPVKQKTAQKRQNILRSTPEKQKPTLDIQKPKK